MLKIILLVELIPMMGISVIDTLLLREKLKSLDILRYYPYHAIVLSACMWVIILRLIF